MLTAIDVFCGCGGLSIGLHQAGFAVQLGLDVEPIAVESYNQNRHLHGGHAVQADLFETSPQELLSLLSLAKGELHLLAGCPPCQGFSSVATRRSSSEIDDKRNDLVDRFGDFVAGLRPHAIMMENVPGLATSPRFERLTCRLQELGYKLKYRIEDAQDYGVPQRRRRLILLGTRHGVPEFAEPVSALQRRTVRDTIGDLAPPGTTGDPLHDVRTLHSDAVMERIRAIPRDGGSRQDAVGVPPLPCHVRSDGFRDVYGRMRWDDVSPTITGGCFNPSKGRFLHPTEDRAITIREALLLQGFPETALVSMRRGKSSAALMIGNAFPPALARPHALKLAALLKGRLCK